MGHIEGELTTEQWYKVIDNILEAGVFEILLSGGEATMRKDLLDIAGYIQKKGASYCLLSNTTLIDDEMAKKLKETGCEKVESNMDGYNAETYDHFRGVEGSFDATVRGIKACLRQGILVRCNVMETKMNIFDLKKIVDVAYEIGVREVCVVPLESGGRARVNRHLAFQEEDIEELHGFYQEVSTWFDKKYGQTDMVLLTPNMLDKKSGSRFAKVFDISGIMPTCGAGKIHCTVDPYGEVKLCPSDEAGFKKEANSLLKKDLRTIKYEIVLIVNQVLMLLSDPTYTLWFLFVHVFLFMLLLLLVEKTYVSTMCRIEHKRKCKKKIKSQSKQNSVVKALCLKEKRGFWSSGLYVTNTMVCIAVFSVVLLGICFVPEKLVKDVLLQTGMGTEIKIMLPMLLAFVVGMSCPTYCSLSFEGKSMGVLKSMPISFRELLISKVQFYVMLVFPFVLVDAAMLEYVVNRQLQIIELVPLLILPLIFSIVIGVIGLWLDMMFGSFEWISPVSIIKQNVTLPLMMLICVTLSGIPASFVFGLHMEPWMAYGVTVLLWIGFGLGFYVLTKKGAKRRLYM